MHCLLSYLYAHFEGFDLACLRNQVERPILINEREETLWSLSQNSFGVDEKTLSLNKCHCIFFVWTCDPSVGTIDGSDHSWKVCNIIKRSLAVSQLYPFRLAIAFETW